MESVPSSSTPNPPSTDVPPPPTSKEHQPPTSTTPAQLPTSAKQPTDQQEQPQTTQKPDSEQERRIVQSPHLSPQTTTNILLAGTNDRQNRHPHRPHRGSGGGTGWVVVEAKVFFPHLLRSLSVHSAWFGSWSFFIITDAFLYIRQVVYVRTRRCIHITPRSVIALGVLLLTSLLPQLFRRLSSHTLSPPTSIPLPSTPSPPHLHPPPIPPHSSPPTHPLSTPLHLLTLTPPPPPIRTPSIPASTIVKRHIDLLHTYNEIRDVGTALMGLIAEKRGVRVQTVYDEMGVAGRD